MILHKNSHFSTSVPSPSLFKLHRATLALALAVAVLFAPHARANLSDTFDRANSATVGNGWIEKNPSAFSISGNQISKSAVGTGYRDNLVYRPAAEDVQDVEASLELRLTNAAAPGYAQILVRVQSASAATADSLTGYILYINDSSSQAVLGRQTGNQFVTTLGTLTLSPALNTTDRFRLRLSARGTSPVRLEAYIERLVGSSWTIIGQSIVDDSAAARIQAPGSVGFGGYVESSYSFDNFVRTNLGGTNNPVPVASSLSPSRAIAGENGLLLTVSGSSFVPTSVVRWGGADRATTFVSATTLEAQITAADLASVGSIPVSVFSPAPGGGASAALTFTIDPSSTPNPVPTLSSLSPASSVAGGAAFTLTVNGTAFASTAVVRWAGANRTTTFVSATQLRASILASDIAAAGNFAVTVFNPAPGGGVSNAQTYNVVAPNPAPVIGSIAPASTTAGSAAFTLNVTGSNFIGSSVVRWNGSTRSTTFVSATELRASISAADVASAGTANVTVFTPTPGGGTSAARTFTINSSSGGGSLALTSVAPQSAIAGQGTLVVTVLGSGFNASSVVRYNGANRATTLVSPTELRATLDAQDVQSLGTGALTVRDSVGGSTTAPLPFFVISSGQSFFHDGFNRPNSATIGNSWTEKEPTAFSISGNEVTSIATEYDYHDAIMYRPSAEDRRDVELAVEFRRIAASNTDDGFPQLHARVQRDSVTQTDTLHSYIFFVDDFEDPPGRAIIAVQPPVPDQYECYIAAIPFPSQLQQGQRYRLRFRVTGSLPVELTGIVERWDGNAWQVFASRTITHDFSTQITPGLFCAQSQMPAPISQAGTMGIAKWRTRPDVYDNFHWVDQTAGASPPSLTTLTPNNAAAGSSGFDLTVRGANFTNNAVVRWNGSNRSTTFVSSTELRATLTAADLATAGTFAVTVNQTGVGAGTSNALNFTVAPPVTGSFVDGFDRADSDVIGNGWIEKTAAAFAIAGGTADKRSVATGYRDNVVYRPSSENVLDTEAAVQFRLRSSAPGYLQVLSRIQTATVATANLLDAYVLYIDNSSTQAVLGRQNGSAFVQGLAAITLTSPLNTTDLYRLRLSTTGTTNVQVNGYIERLTSGSWQTIGQASVTDSSAQRIATAGSVGFGGYTEASYFYDNFTRQ